MKCYPFSPSRHRLDRLRTGGTVAVAEEKKKLKCRKCGAVLREGNPGPLCAPCQGRPQIVIPEGFIVLAETDSSAWRIRALAEVIREFLGITEEKKEQEEI